MLRRPARPCRGTLKAETVELTNPDGMKKTSDCSGGPSLGEDTSSHTTTHQTTEHREELQLNYSTCCLDAVCVYVNTHTHTPCWRDDLTRRKSGLLTVLIQMSPGCVQLS